jgi:hypothetical protein
MSVQAMKEPVCEKETLVMAAKGRGRLATARWECGPWLLTSTEVGPRLKARSTDVIPLAARTDTSQHAVGVNGEEARRT